MLRAPARIRDRRRGQLQPKPLAATCGRPDLNATHIADTTPEQWRLVLTRGGVVICPPQLRPSALTDRVDVVLEHVQQGGVGFDEFEVAADSRDANRRALVNRTVVGLAASKGLRNFAAPDELAD